MDNPGIPPTAVVDVLRVAGGGAVFVTGIRRPPVLFHAREAACLRPERRPIIYPHPLGVQPVVQFVHHEIPVRAGRQDFVTGAVSRRAVSFPYLNVWRLHFPPAFVFVGLALLLVLPQFMQLSGQRMGGGSETALLEVSKALVEQHTEVP